MSGHTCDVCGGRSTCIASSSLGPCSFAYCDECISMGAEPYGMTVVTAAMMGAKSLDALGEWSWPMFFATVLRAGKTAEQWWADVAAEVEHQYQEERRYFASKGAAS